MPEFRIGDYNYLFDSTVGLSAHSEDPSFPASHLSDFSLAKVYRSSGYFVVDSTNNKLDFTDGGGALVATIASGTYTAAQLAAAIDTALEAAGGADYTVSYSSSTGKWTITSNGATFTIKWLTGTNTATSIGSTIGFDVTSDDTGALTYTGAKIAIHTVERLIIDLRSTEEIDSFAAIWDKANGSRFSANAVVKLKGSATNSWASPGVSVTLAYDETYNLMTHFFSSSQSYRYWCVEVVDPENPALYIELPKLFLCKATQLVQVPEIGMGLKEKDQSKGTETAYGHRYTDIYPSLRMLDWKYAALSKDDLATLEDTWARVGCSAPIFVSLDSAASLYDKDRFFMYGYLKEDFNRSHNFYSFWNTALVLEEAQ